MLHTISHYTRKLMMLGPKRFTQVIISRIKNEWAVRYWRRRALTGVAQHTWQQITPYFRSHKFSTFFESQRLRSLMFVSCIYAEDIHKNQLMKDADFFVQNGMRLFGDLHYMTQISWHTDINCKLKNPLINYDFDPFVFYKDIKIASHVGKEIDKDIKVPWELSRFQYLFVLGNAYQLTHDKKYSDFFVQQVSHWLDNNPYLFGVNWACPMEVGLRAINWVIAFSFFKDADINEAFWERFIGSLYDHFVYLEHNWEIYDSRTSNHYLSDLVGYLYLCWFFKDLKDADHKLPWVQQEIMKEMKKQILEDGSDYEGSTHYHRLVTELFYHASLMFKECNIPAPHEMINKLTDMFAFINWCTPEGGNLISVGDNDSGRVLYYGLPKTMGTHDELSGLRFFSQFGLSIIKNKAWHISLRHHAYKKYQPSGHFHNDVGSITVAIGGIPVIVDPGSYIYTPSVYWRNKFRSVSVHNTCYLDDIEPVPLNSELFCLDIQENRAQNSMCVMHNLYKQFGLSFERELSFDEFENRLIITDQWLNTHQSAYPKSVWNFTLGPEINAKKENNRWLLQHKDKTLLVLYADDLDFELQDAWVSFEYGKKIKSTCLRAKKDVTESKVIAIYLVLFQ